MAVTSDSAARFQPGTLVHARGRDWVVLPSTEPDLLLLRPLTGSASELTGIYLPLEGSEVKAASFAPPDPSQVGDAVGGLLLYDAARLSIRNGAAPFRSLGQLSVEPRPYQFVPLIMALRLDPVRLLIADDVGVGKTIEAGLIARELLDRGLAKRLAVLCPSHLCEQWANELRDKFALDPRVVQPSQINRLQRELPRPNLSVYQHYPHLVLSIDYVKSERQRDAFLRNAADLIIVDEAHIAARPRGQTRKVQQERHALLQDLAKEPNRHLLLVTATPHSGIEESFNSLLGLLDPQFDQPSAEGEDSKKRNKHLLPYVVQRRRADLVQWLGVDTPFPERRSTEVPYNLSADYASLFDDVLAFTQDTVQQPGLGSQQQRVRHWAAIAILRCLLSSPAAAVAVLSKRERGEQVQAVSDDDDDADSDATCSPPPAVEESMDVDATYSPQVMDVDGEDEAAPDHAPTAPVESAARDMPDSKRRRFAAFRCRARALAGRKADKKLAAAFGAVSELLREGFRPIVFCRFIATANYLAAQLQELLAGEFPDLRIEAVTGELLDEQRRLKVAELSEAPRRLLVATDCLSEGINLQESFDAILHYDLPWNPNRLEQREGRVDRFGQHRREVRTVMLYGANNPMDMVVLEVLINKARAIRQRLGIAVPVPVESDQVMQAVVDSVLLRRRISKSSSVQLSLALETNEVSRLHQAWDAAGEREDRQRAFFSQHGIRPEEVARELETIDRVFGAASAVRHFLANASQRFHGSLKKRDDGVYELQPGRLKQALQERGQGPGPFAITFDSLTDERAQYVGRTHPLVAAFCEAVLGEALAPQPNQLFARAGAVYTSAVPRRTVLLLLRLRYLLRERGDQYAEEVLVAAWNREQGWLQPLDTHGRELLERAQPSALITDEERSRQVEWALRQLDQPDWYAPLVRHRVAQLEEAHARLRPLLKTRPLKVEPRTPPDILGCYVLVPAGGGA